MSGMTTQQSSLFVLLEEVRDQVARLKAYSVGTPGRARLVDEVTLAELTLVSELVCRLVALEMRMVEIEARTGKLPLPEGWGKLGRNSGEGEQGDLVARVAALEDRFYEHRNRTYVKAAPCAWDNEEGKRTTGEGETWD